jgi:hypothetical protein
MALPRSRVLRRKQQDTETLLNLQEHDFAKPKSHVPKEKLASIAQQVAQDSFFYVNHYYPGGRENFGDIAHQTVDKYFPYALGGPLFIDEPQNERDENICEEKKAIMEKLGHRYIIIKRGMSEIDIMELLP